MSSKPQLSVILTFKNQREEAENTLTTLYELEQLALELIVIDDGSSDGTREAIHSVLDHYQHEETYFFEHEDTRGRGNSLNEGLHQVTGNVLWAPGPFHEIDEDHLVKVLKALEKSGKTGLLQRPHMVPETIEEWVEYLDSQALPRDAVFLWNMEQIPSRELFFSPHLINHHGTELAARVLTRENAGLIDPFFTIGQPEEPIKPDLNIVSEFVFTLLRRPDLTSEQKDFLLDLLNPSVSEEIPEEEWEENDQELYQKAVTYYRAGNISAALEFVDGLLDKQNDHEKARKLKIEILEKLRRYVEAAELKYELKHADKEKPSQVEEKTGKTDETSQETEEDQSAEDAEQDGSEEETFEAESDQDETPDLETEDETGQPEDREVEHTEEQESTESDEDEVRQQEFHYETKPVEEAELDDEDVEQEIEDAVEEHSADSEDQQLQKSERIEVDLEVEGDEIVTTIIIPTTGNCKSVLEQCLVSISEHLDPTIHELVIVDNASLDDTHDYLEQLEEDEFFNCRIITNSENAGFAASVNRGLDEARGRYACILHNDVRLKDNAVERLAEQLKQNEDFGIVGPIADNTINPEQRIEEIDGEHTGLREVDYLDSFCMVLRTEMDLRLDEEFGLAYFEDVDLSFQAKNNNYKVGTVPDVAVEHFFGVTTVSMGLDLDSKLYWRNAARFNEKWNLQTELPEEIEEVSPVEQLLTLNDLANPWYPEEQLKEYFDELMTDEVRTTILKSDLSSKVLLELVDLMISMDRRDILRSLEDKVEDAEIPDILLSRIVRYYLERNIFSRCKHYINKLDESEKGVEFRLVELQMAVVEKRMDDAVNLLNELMEETPAHPKIYKLAGDIHQFEGNTEESDSFYRLAEQLDPFHYSRNQYLKGEDR